MTRPYARVIVEVAPAHLDRPFDYRVPDGADVGVGSRVRVDFAGRRRVGWVVGTAGETTTDPDRVRELAAVDGARRWFDAEDLPLLRWVADRWAGSLSDVLRHAMPKRIVSEERLAERRAASSSAPAPPAGGAAPAAPAAPAAAAGGVSTSPAIAGQADTPSQGSAGAEGGMWAPYGADALLSALQRGAPGGAGPAFWLRALGDADVPALGADLVARCLSAGRSALVLVPDPAAPLPAAVLAVAGAAGVDLRGASDRDRYRAFLRGRDGDARVVVGERSAVLAPLRDLGLVLVDDEANPAYKERRAPRHHARDVALARARMAGAAAVLLGDLPSANLWRLVEAGHVTTVAADRATEREHAPMIQTVDRADPRPGAQRARFSDRSSRALRETVREGRAAIVVAARGGAGSALACQGCRARLACPICEGSLRPRKPDGGAADVTPTWECPACTWAGAPFACTFCGDDRSAPLAAGAGRLAQELARSHPEAEVMRMEGFDAPGPTARPAIGVMTRGSVVARPAWLGDEPVGAIVLPDADAFIGRPTMDSAEDGLRLWFALARWAAAGGDAGAAAGAAAGPASAGRDGVRTTGVWLQTREPGNPAVQALVRWDPEGFWRREAPRRAELRYPPAAALVRLTVPPKDAARAAAELREVLPPGDDLLGPGPDGAALVKTGDLHGTLSALTPLRHAWSKDDRKIRIDVDPVATD
jgi:primosomal protein N' (replication factor Y) (superfamily II helicase)